jgi:hypothetical protein
MNTQIPSMTTRRQAMVGAASVIITTGISSRASAFIVPWAGQIAGGVAAGWLVEALKSWGLVPEARASTAPTVYNDHRQNVVVLQQQGYSVRPLYSGGSAAGDFALSEATLGEDFAALGTTSHDDSTCTLRLDKVDTVNLGVVASALRQKGFAASAVEAAGHPIHPRANNEFVGNERYSPEYMTPAHGTIEWKTNLSNPRPNAITAIRSGIVSCNVHVARRDGGGWTFDMRPPVDLRYA